MHRVTLYSLTAPSTPMLFREFERRPEAYAWRRWAIDNLPCRARLEPKHGA